MVLNVGVMSNSGVGDQLSDIKEYMSNFTSRWETQKTECDKVVISLLIVAIVLLISNIGVTVYSMRKNKKGLKRVNRFSGTNGNNDELEKSPFLFRSHSMQGPKPETKRQP